MTHIPVAKTKEATVTKHPDDDEKMKGWSPVRQLVWRRTYEMRTTLAELSRALGRNESYLHQFVNRATPRRLDEDDRRKLSTLLQVDERLLRDEPPPLFLAATGEPAVCHPTGTNHTQPNSNLPRLTPSQIPIFFEGDTIDVALATNWVEPVLTGQAAAAWAVWISRPRPYLRAGDIAFVRTDGMPRLGDLVVVVEDAKVVRMGSLSHISSDFWGVSDGDGDPASQNIHERKSSKVYKIVGVSMV